MHFCKEGFIIMNENVNHGIHPHAMQEINKYFSQKETNIAQFWENEWYITNAGQVPIGQSEYKYMLIKATQTYEEALSLSREIVVIFSPYKVFEPRTLDAFEYVYKKFHDNRLERICYVLISADLNIETNLENCLSNQESQVIVPFTYDSFKESRGNNNFIRNQFRRFFYSRDLFDYSDPLKKDYYFFGRNDLTIEIIEKHKANQNTGLFGLRKTGKTSIIYDIIRKISQRDGIGILIDCQSTALNFRRWNKALFYILLRVYEETKIPFPTLNEDQFTEIDAALLFEKYMKLASRALSKSILLLFDEIENISFEKSSVPHWCDDLDFVYFWQSIRSTFQNTEGVFTFCILGTNPRCIEQPTIKQKDNPIFNAFQPKYIPGFDQAQTREMVRKLGRLMGMKFDDGVYTRLTEDYGGHPFLIRQVCSKLAQEYIRRPVQIDRGKYAIIRDKFNKENDYFNMLLEVLIQFYPDEYEMLKLLAKGDTVTFTYFASGDYSMIKHLIGYGIIKEVDGKYDFVIDTIKEYLLVRVQKNLQTAAEKWTHLCTGRNDIEFELRKMVKLILRIAYKTESEAKDAVVRKIHGNDIRKYSSCSYSELFDSRKNKIFLRDLKELIKANWDFFKDYWNKQDMFLTAMDVLNNEGRFDAHATLPEDSEIILVNGAIDILRKGIENYRKYVS